MKQILQHLGNGNTRIVETSIPQLKPGGLIIKSKISLISTGTERMLIEFGKSNLLNKALKQPARVKDVIKKIKTDGLYETYSSVKNKLNDEIPLGYCNVGEVIDSNVPEFKVGDRVVSNGPHAEIISVSKNLCSKIPENVTDEEAVFTVLASVGLQGIRLINPVVGDKVGVFGLGLIGILTYKILEANGCEVIAFEANENRLKLAKKLNIRCFDSKKEDSSIRKAKNLSNNNGLDAVLITASAEKDNIIHQSAQMLRKRGKVVLVGVVNLNLSRDDFYEKEITFQVSSSYGAGRYDSLYEEKGIDYPIEYARWTVKRNFETVLNLIKNKRINLHGLISQRYKFNECLKAYQHLNNSNLLSIVIQYEEKNKNLKKNFYKTNNITNDHNSSVSDVKVGFIGAGNYAQRVLIPSVIKNSARVIGVSSFSGLSSKKIADKHSIDYHTSNNDKIFFDKKINTILISTRHDTHYDMVVKGLNNKKNIFVEKPLALKINHVNEIEKKLNKSKNIFAVGFNRRFSKYTSVIKILLDSEQEVPKNYIYTINAGKINLDHWTLDSSIGGGRIVGEVCHFLDLLRFLDGTNIISWQKYSSNINTNDAVAIMLKFKSGSVGVINYLSNGDKGYPKEKLEIFVNEKILSLNNFRSLKGYGWKNFRSQSSFTQDKGQELMIKKFIESIKKKSKPIIPYQEIFEISKLAIDIQNN